MRKTNIKIDRYESGGFWIDIIDEGETYGAWITEKGRGISSFMFGCMKDQTPYDYFLELVEGNLPQYKRGYIEDLEVYEDAMCAYIEEKYPGNG